MKKLLITGFSGFVCKHFLDLLDSTNEQIEVFGISRKSNNYFSYKNLKIKCYSVDLKNAELTHHLIDEIKPDWLVHLASDSSVGYSWKEPVSSFQNNTNIFLNVVEGIRKAKLKTKILSIGSSEEYGVVLPESIPLKETQTLNPVSPYAVARVSQEMISKIYVNGYGLDIILTRSFNHIGPGQKDNFVISSFAKQLISIYSTNAKPEIITGDVSIIRDFLDVRDVVKAYIELLLKGKSGEVYNICSGNGISLKSIIEIMSMKLNLQVTTIANSDLIRPNDNAIIVGDNTKIKTATGWDLSYSLEESLNDILEYWKLILKNGNIS